MRSNKTFMNICQTVRLPCSYKFWLSARISKGRFVPQRVIWCADGAIGHFKSQGVRIVQGIFLCTSHGIAQTVTRAEYQAFVLKNLFVNGQECHRVVKGQEVPWAEDIAIVQENDLRQDSGAVAELFGSSIAKITYKLGRHLPVEGFLNSNNWGHGRHSSLLPSCTGRTSPRSLDCRCVRHARGWVVPHSLGLPPYEYSSDTKDVDFYVVGIFRGTISPENVRICFFNGFRILETVSMANLQPLVKFVTAE